jgi:hypothetical protein
MGKSIVRIVLIACFVLPTQLIYAQSGVGIGTSNPNPNAVLDIMSAANDKGILIPRLTSTQRLAMNASLSVTENGLLVFDLDLQEFYYWNNTVWTAVSVIQDLQLIGNSLSITNNSSATIIDLSPFSGTNTDNQDLSSSSSGNNRTIDITGGNSTTFNVADNDNNAANELQTISKAGATVTLSNGGGSFVDDDTDPDADPTNELQTISKVGSTVTLSNGGGSFDDDDIDADANPANELQTISKVGSTVTLSNGGGSFDDDDIDADADPTNELQTLSLAGSVLTISSGNNVTLPSSTPIKEAFKAHRKTTEAFVKGLYQLPFESVDYDLNGTYNAAVGDYKALVDGIYHFDGTLIVNLSTLSFADIIIVVNGSDMFRNRLFAPGADIDFSIDFSTDLRLAGGDSVQLFLEIQGGNFTIIGGQELTHMSGRLVVEL